jgi:Zn-dependent peptidase ImmA (M78 family)/transcriptional regulator with XRE-family HTH domain
VQVGNHTRAVPRIQWGDRIATQGVRKDNEFKIFLKCWHLCGNIRHPLNESFIRRKTMDLNTVLGTRIKEARNRLGVTQQQLADAAGLEHIQTVSQIENGERAVKAWELARLAGVLHTSIGDLLKEEPLVAPVVLWRDQPDNGYQEIETEFILLSRNYNFVERLSGAKSKAQLPLYRGPGETFGYREAGALAAEVGQTMNLGRVPATSLTKILEEDFGIKIFYRDELAGSAASAVGDFGQAILMNASEAPWRRNYNFAHELFHLLTWDAMPPARLRQDEGLREQFEKFANFFASCLLLPADCVVASFEKRLDDRKISFADLIEIAQEFDVSTEALLWRLVNLRRLDREVVGKALGDPEFRQLDRSTMSGRWWNPQSLSDRYVRLCRLCFQKGQLSRAKLADLLGKSLAELRRDIKALEQQTSEAELSIA